MKKEKKARDPRVNTKFISIKDYVLIFIVLMTVNSAHILIYHEVMATVGGDGNNPIVYIVLGSYIFFMTLLVCLLWVLFRHLTYNRPMKRLGAAARQIAAGDFGVRVQPMRRDGKKDYVEVMFDDFNTMAEELSTTETLKSDFIANVSHELKTPLSVIQSYASALQSSRLSDGERREYAHTIVTASQKLSTLVTNILQLNKLENQEIVSGAAVYDVCEQLRQCALTFEEQWERKGITFSAEIEDEALVCLDENMTEIVWNNLLSNAIKFTEAGGTVTLRQVRQNGYAVVTVGDTGCGMDADTGRHIFDKFYQGDTSHAQQGNGLGLALVKRVIDIAEGGITVDSEPGAGSTFTVRLPLHTGA